ncbi:MAG: methyltransferase domain-containing protein [Alphaproteobacteria bacterium]|nr:methyltransferase domain-containing protein [Alphaproteobacteria bacterium]
MSEKIWRNVDAYIGETLVQPDEALEQALHDSRAAGLPPIAVSAAQGKQLYLTALSIGARRILEVGTLGGYSSIWMARALPADGQLISLEIDPKHAEVARGNIERAGLGSKVDVRVGPAIDLLPKLEGPFDLSFIDADKESNAEYFAHALRLSRKGSVIIVDNVVREGKVIDPKGNAQVQGVRRMFDLIASEPRVSATAIQTVGDKGYDGYLLAVVTG